MLVLEDSARFVDVSGLGGHCHYSSVFSPPRPSFPLTKEMSLMSSIRQHSLVTVNEMEKYGTEINDKSLWLPGGKQRILMDGYQVPYAFRNGINFHADFFQQTKLHPCPI
jgi:hypothetical protein